MENAGVRNGLFMGGALIALNMIMYLFDARFMIDYGSWTSFLVYILFMVKAGREEKESLNGFASFGEMLKPTFLAYAIGTFIASIFAYVLYNFIDPSLMDVILEKSLEAMDKLEGLLGADAVELAKEKIEEDGIGMGISDTIFGYAFMLLLGFVFSLIISAVLKKDNPSIA